MTRSNELVSYGGGLSETHHFALHAMRYGGIEGTGIEGTDGTITIARPPMPHTGPSISQPHSRGRLSTAVTFALLINSFVAPPKLRGLGSSTKPSVT